jgi:CTP synthase
MPDRPLKVLIIEDDPPVAQTIKDSIQEKVASECVIEGSFEKALAIVGPQFDVVILDQLKGAPPNRDLAGRPVWKHIYEDAFVPVIIYSATELAMEDEFPADNPILIHIAKGQSSEVKLANHISSQRHIYLGLKALKKELSGVTRDVFLKVAPVLLSGNAERLEAEAKHLIRAARRRIAAMMDHQTLTGENLQAWEQYICPPLSTRLLTGDILHLNAASEEDPASYRIMLTPSCDLPRPPTGKAKVNAALVCHCVPFVEFIKAVKASQSKEGDFKTGMSTALTRAHVNGFLPLPSYHNKIPSMAAALKSLDLIALGDIGEHHKYKVVASIDSPFREQISWAFIEVQGRPGIPERDLDIWITELWTELQRQRNETKSGNIKSS